MNNKKIPIAARTLAIGMVAALVLVETALGKNQEKDATNLVLGILFFAIGLVLNYFGWKIYHLYIMIIGFILGSIIGALTMLFTGAEKSIEGFLFLVIVGIAGAWLAPKIEKAIFLILAFVIGLIPGYIISDSLGLFKYGFTHDNPLGYILAIIIAISIAIIAWKVYKFFIIFSLSFIGSLLMQIGYTSASNSEFFETSPILFLVFLISGIFVQYMKKNQAQKMETKTEKEGKTTVNLTSFVLPTSIKGFKTARLYLISGILLSLIGSGYLLDLFYNFEGFIIGIIILYVAVLLFKSNDKVILSNQEIVSSLVFITAFNVFLKILFYGNFIIFYGYVDPVYLELFLEYRIRYFLYIVWWSHGIKGLSALSESFYQTLILSLFIEIISFVYLYKSFKSRKLQKNN